VKRTAARVNPLMKVFTIFNSLHNRRQL